jgi:F-type H+-transporting ATPase subunit alpha
LKLAYSQFEELETFAKFGTRLDEHTRKIIAHGRRIRACLKQPASSPIPLAEQIVVLLALTNGYFDPVPLARMKEAELALRKTAAELPDEIRQRFVSTSPFGEDDRRFILQMAEKALEPFTEQS